MLAILRNLNECDWLYVHNQINIIKLGNIQRIDNTRVHEKLRIACQYGCKDAVQTMINMDINFNWGLYGACYGGHLDLAKLMIQKGADDFNSGLYGACRGGHLDLAKLMIQKGADDFSWGLSGASHSGHLKLVQLMILMKQSEYSSECLE